jgi:hypothetical protein
MERPVRYLAIVLAGCMALAGSGCSEAAPTSTASAPAIPTVPASEAPATATTVREAYKEAWNTLGLTVRFEQVLAIAKSIGGSEYPDVDALSRWIEAQQQALEDLLPAQPSLEYRRVHEAMMAAFGDLLTACPFKVRYDADRQDLEAYAALQGLTRGALIRLRSTEQEFNVLLAAIGHSPVDFGDR